MIFDGDIRMKNIGAVTKNSGELTNELAFSARAGSVRSLTRAVLLLRLLVLIKEKEKNTAGESAPPQAQNLKRIIAVCLSVGLLTFVAIVLFTPPATRVVLLPTVVTLATVSLFAYILHIRTEWRLQLFELGLVYAGFVTLYSSYPILSYFLNGQLFAGGSDARFYGRPPTPEEVGTVAWYCAIHLMCFALGYVLARGRLSPDESTFRKPDVPSLSVIFIAYLTIKGFFLFLNLFYDIAQPDSYAETYLMYNELPLLLRQAANILGSMLFTVQILLLLALVRRRHWLLLGGWISAELLIAFSQPGSRLGTFIILLSSIIAYHRFIKPPTLKLVTIEVGAVFTLFLVLGLIRSGLGLSGGELTSNFFSRGSEFEALYGNALDMLRSKNQGLVPHFSLAEFYLTDLIKLIPSQLLPFEKYNLGNWYVNTFYIDYAQTGGGYAFGTIAESITGFGWFDVIWRGAALGIIFGKVHRYYTVNQKTFFKSAFYIWLTVMSYQAFRDTTFSLLYLFLYQFLLPIIAMSIIIAVVRNKRAV